MMSTVARPAAAKLNDPHGNQNAVLFRPVRNTREFGQLAKESSRRFAPRAAAPRARGARPPRGGQGPQDWAMRQPSGRFLTIGKGPATRTLPSTADVEW